MDAIVVPATLLILSVGQISEAAEELIKRGDYTQAAAVLESAREQAATSGPRELAAVLNNLGTAYWNLGRLRDAQNAFERSLSIREAAGETESRDVARTLNNLGMMYTGLGLLSKAEATILRAAGMHEKLGGDDPGIARFWLNLGVTYRAEQRPEQAEAMFRKALAYDEHGASTEDVALALNNLGVLLRDRGRLAEAGPLLERAAILFEKEFGPWHPLVASAQNNLGVLNAAAGDYRGSLHNFERAIQIAEVSLPADHPNLASYRASYAAILRKLDRGAEAKRQERIARDSRERYARENLLGHTVDAHAK